MSFAIDDVCARIEIAGNRSNGNILIGSPGGFRQNAGAVGADVDRGSNLMRGILKTVELDQHLLGDAAFGPDRRKYLSHVWFSPFASQGAVARCRERDFTLRLTHAPPHTRHLH